MLGSGAVIVIDDSNSMVDILSVIMNFYHHESCGQMHPLPGGNRLAGSNNKKYFKRKRTSAGYRPHTKNLSTDDG